MCELGHKVRADVKIRNRQPLRNLYVLFSNKEIQDYMVYVDCAKKEYQNIFSDELNVFNVEFVESVDRFFNYNLKPNFRTLGPKGYGKQAQTLKTHLAALSVSDKNELFEKLKTEVVTVANIPLTQADLELEYIPKPGYFAATGKVGAIVLDTNLDADLLEKGFIADFRSALQNVRKVAELDLTDRIYLEIFCKKSDVLEKYSNKLMKDLLATGIAFLPFEKINNVLAHRFDVGNETFYVNLFKVVEK
jgi:isoleucyl-tRNA synthetase